MNGIKKFKWIIGTTSIILVAFLAVVMNSDKWEVERYQHMERYRRMQ